MGIRIYESLTTTSSPSPDTNVFGLFLVVLPPMLGGLLYGFDIGATSFVLAMLLKSPTPTNTPTPTLVGSSGDVVDHLWWEDLSSTRQGLIVSSLSLGALLGSHVLLVYLAKRIGRRTELRLCAVFYILGSVSNVLSGTLLKGCSFLGFAALCFGRVLYGIGVGFVMHGAPAYLAEMSPSRIRGAVVSAKETVIVGGIVLGYLVGNAVSSVSGDRGEDPAGWTKLYGFCGLMAVPMLALTRFIPRSMRWLLLRGCDEEARESMKFVYLGDVTEEFETLKTNLRASAKEQREEPSLLDPRYRKAIAASTGLIVFQQLSAQPR